MPDVVFSVKDTQGRYVAMSGACVPRCSLRDKRDAIGKTAYDLFPNHMADRYSVQDAAVFCRGRPVVDNLDLTVYNDKRTGWCLSNKQSVYDKQGKLLGLICISKDLTELTREGLINERFAQTVDFIQANYHRQLCLQELAEVADLSVAQLDRRMKRVFHISTGEFVRQTRLDAAIHAMVSTQRALADIAVECGFFDQSAFHRQCRQSVGMSPRALRMQAKG
ncbi:AraC family transcriptional regulator [Chitinimonas arctica]|uniref:AraC family transcriptional regulator n=1 Tax=Chitinimonas arctica TaxID=2594795 RepID=A0A516SMM4_9NEIS|nr:AraC family transcriptional regulator [Chitinimonas arctica]